MNLSDAYSNIKSGSTVNKLLGVDSIFTDIEKKKNEQSKFLDSGKERFLNPSLNYRKSVGNNEIENKDTTVLKYADDPTLLGFKLLPSLSSPLFNINISESDEEQEESAFAYLISINQQERAKKLLNFIESFKLLVQDYPYYLQELSGLGDIYKIEDKKSYYERKIKLKTYESIDLFISSMMHDYINAVYDYNELKWVVPMNLLYFDLIIYISEVRKFKTVYNIISSNQKLTSVNNVTSESYLEDTSIDTVLDKDSMFLLNKYIGAYAIRFNRCTFMSENINTYLTSVSNQAPKSPENEIGILLGKMSFHLTNLHPFSHVYKYYEELYPLVNDIKPAVESELERFNANKDKSNKGIFDLVGDTIKKEAAKTANGLIKQVTDKVENTVNLGVSKLETLGKELVSEYAPSNIINRLTNDELSKVSKTVNDGLNSLINDLESNLTNKTGNLADKTKGEQVASLLVNQNVISQSTVYNGKNNTHVINTKSDVPEFIPDIKKINKGIKSSYSINLKEETKKTKEEDLRKKVLTLILDGTDGDKLLRDTLFLGNTNQKIK